MGNTRLQNVVFLYFVLFPWHNMLNISGFKCVIRQFVVFESIVYLEAQPHPATSHTSVEHLNGFVVTFHIITIM